MINIKYFNCQVQIISLCDANVKVQFPKNCLYRVYNRNNERAKDNSSQRNKKKMQNKTVSISESLFSRRSSLKIHQVDLKLVNSTF